MKFTANREALLVATQRAAAAVQAKAATVAFREIRFDATRDGLGIFGAGAATTIKTVVKIGDEVDIRNTGSAGVIAKDFVALLKAFTTPTVQVSLEGAHVVVKAGSSRYQLHATPQGDGVEEPTPQGDEIREYVVAVAELAAALDEVAYAACQEEERAAISGIYFDFKGAAMTAVATDGHRLAASTRERIGGPPKSLFLPLEATRALRDLLANIDVESTVTIRDDGRRAFVESDDFVFSARLTDSAFPAYDKVIPRSYLFSFQVSAASMRHALARVALIADNGRKGSVVFRIGDTLSIEADSADRGACVEEVVVANRSGDTPTKPFGARISYIDDALAQIERSGHKDAFLHISGPLAPIVVSIPVHSDTCLSVVMPVRV